MKKLKGQKHKFCQNPYAWSSSKQIRVALILYRTEYSKAEANRISQAQAQGGMYFQVVGHNCHALVSTLAGAGVSHVGSSGGRGGRGWGACVPRRLAWSREQTEAHTLRGPRKALAALQQFGEHWCVDDRVSWGSFDELQHPCF